MKASPGPAGDWCQRCHSRGDTEDTVGTHHPSLTRLSHLGDVHTLLRGHEAEHGEDNEASKEAGAAVDHSQDVGIPVGTASKEVLEGTGGHTTGSLGCTRGLPAAGIALPVAVVVEAVVAAQCGQSTQPDGVGEEDLGASINPDLGCEEGCQGVIGVPGGCLAPNSLLASPLPSPVPQPAWTSQVSGSR